MLAVDKIQCQVLSLDEEVVQVAKMVQEVEVKAVQNPAQVVSEEVL